MGRKINHWEGKGVGLIEAVIALVIATAGGPNVYGVEYDGVSNFILIFFAAHEISIPLLLQFAVTEIPGQLAVYQSFYIRSLLPLPLKRDKICGQPPHRKEQHRYTQ
jgi:hypothetical protein